MRRCPGYGACARWERLPAWLVDGGITALVIAVNLTLLAYLVPVVSQIPGLGFSRVECGGGARFALAARLPLVLRRRYPRVVLAVVTATILLERLIALPASAAPAAPASSAVAAEAALGWEFYYDYRSLQECLNRGDLGLIHGEWVEYICEKSAWDWDLYVNR